MPRIRSRIVSALAIGALAVGSGCQSTGDPFLDALCESFGFTILPSGSLSLRDGETRTLDMYLINTATCPTTGSLTGFSDNPAAIEFGMAVGTEISASMAPAGIRLPRSADDRVVHFGMTMKLNLAGSFNAELRYANPDAHVTTSLPFTVISMPARGVINVQISGLPAEAQADVDVGIDHDDELHFTASRAAKFYAGDVKWKAFSVTAANGTVYVPTPSIGVVPLAIGDTRTLSIVYAAELPVMGMANVQISGLPAGVSGGTVTVSGNGVNQTVTQSSSLQLAAGVYTFTANTASNTVNDFADPQSARQVAISAGQVTNVLFAYAVVATLVNFNVLGLESGLTPLIALTRGAETRTIAANTAAVKLAVGLWTIAMVERVVSGRTYGRTGASAATLTVLAQSNAMALALAYYCFRWQWQAAATFGVFSDPYGHLLFINMLMTAHLMGVSWQFPDPAPANAFPGARLAHQTVTQETVTITGQGAFVPVTGTRATNGALSLTGSGTVAGYTNVPVALTGTLTNAGALAGVQYRMGQVANPTGLPGGPIIYTISAPAAPAILGFGGAAAVRR